MASTGQLEIRSVADQVYGVLLRRIVSGDLPPGAHLRQEALASELGVSRTPLREALRRLASEGFVEFAVNHGATVTDRDLAAPESVRAARRQFEPALARLAAEVRDAEGLEALRRSLSQTDADFHLAVAATTANPHLIRFAEILWMAQPDPRAALTDHAAIAEAIERGDREAAERLSRLHVGD
jgi:DNA-binding GntR family transcriptional regulator